MTLGSCNYVEIKTPIPWANCFAYVDTENYLADEIFISREIPVKFEKREFQKEGSPYVVVFCRINKRYFNKFLVCMAHLERKALLNGYTDYSQFCRETLGQFSENK